jgi:hypothetical protein
MTVWMTKVWGWGEPVGPLQFGTPGARDTARANLEPGDLVVLVGTMGPETGEHHKNRLLGLMEPTTEPVMTLDYLTPDRPEHLKENGEYKWPYGLLNRAAWTFGEPTTRLAAISSRRFGPAAAQGIVRLTPAEAHDVMKLSRRAAPLQRSIRVAARLDGDDAAMRRSSPPPSVERRASMHMRREPAFTYALELTKPPMGARTAEVVGYKIGWAFEWKRRMRTFNKAAMPEIGGLRYGACFFERWSTATEAYRMEQAVLERFNASRHVKNHEVLFGITKDALHAEWLRCVNMLLTGRR